MTYLTNILKKGMVRNGIPIAPTTDGSVKYSSDHRFWRGDGFNSKNATSGAYTVTAPGDLGAGKTVNLKIVEGRNSLEIPVRNDTATAIPLDDAIGKAINGSANSIVFFSALSKGYKATVGTDIVTITGKPGIKFSVVAGGGYGGAGNPAIPTITQTVVPFCPGNLPAGRAVVTDLVANYQGSKLDGSVANEAHKIVSLPTGSATSTLVGLSVQEGMVWGDASSACCGSGEEIVDPNCHDCIHWLRLEPGNQQQVKVTLEVVSGDTTPSNIIGTPISYRETGTAANPTIGVLSVGAPVGDTNRKLFKHLINGAQLVILGVVDAASNQYFVGVAP